MNEFKIGDLSIRVPIVQGGMGVGISLANLATAVANEGGIGVIATVAVGLSEEGFFTDLIGNNIIGLRNEIKKVRDKTNGVLGVNIMVALTNYEDMVKTSIEEGVDIIFSGAGLPLNLPEYLKEDSKTKLVPIISSGRAANLILKRWYEKFDYVADAIVLEGPMAGGHLGFKYEQIDDENFTLEKILPDVLKVVKEWEEKTGKKIPVIAGGGIYTGADIKKIMDMGASGVQMATRFVTTNECDATLAFKNAYINSKKEDINIINSPVGLPGRAITNTFIKDVQSGKTIPVNCPYKCIRTCKVEESPYCIAIALLQAKKGNVTQGLIFAGANAYKTDKIISVKELMDTLEEEYVNA